MPTHYTVSSIKPTYGTKPLFDSLKAARSYRAAQPDSSKLHVWICQDACDHKTPLVRKIPDDVPDTWTHWE